MTYAKEIDFPGGTSYAVTDFDPSSVLGKPYTVSSEDEALVYRERVVQVACDVCDKPDEGTAQSLEARGWWLRSKATICSVACLFVRADEKIAAFDTLGCPF